jgi:hypothetical protein
LNPTGGLEWRHHAEAAMRSLAVETIDPVGDHDAFLEQAVELFAVQQLVAYRAAKAFEEPVLLRAALLDEGGLHRLAAGKPVGRLAAMDSRPLSERRTAGLP